MSVTQRDCLTLWQLQKKLARILSIMRKVKLTSHANSSKIFSFQHLGQLSGKLFILSIKFDARYLYIHTYVYMWSIVFHSILPPHKDYFVILITKLAENSPSWPLVSVCAGHLMKMSWSQAKSPCIPGPLERKWWLSTMRTVSTIEQRFCS